MSSGVGPGRHVFVSHTADMGHYPRPTSFAQGVFAAANRAGLVPVDMSYFEAREGKTVDYCRQRVREAELYVAVIGFRIGSFVPGTTTSYTEAEFLEAGAAGRERLVFLLDEDAPIPTSFVDENRCDVEAFRQRLRDAGVVATFSSVEQLELKVHQAFSAYLQRTAVPGPNGSSDSKGEPHGVDESAYMDRVTPVSSFSTQRLADFRTKMRPDVMGETPEQVDATEFLRHANLLRDGHLTNAGVLLFGEDPTAIIPHAVVQCAKFSGETRISPLECRDLRGTVPELIERARDFVGNACLLGEVPSSDGAYAEPTYDVPMIAVREVIANAVVHRDYERTGSCVHVRVFSDRVEVVNPGTWGDSDAIRDGQYQLHKLRREPSRRNFRLASVLRWSGLVEGEGTGVPRAIDDSKRLGTAEPTVLLADRRVIMTVNRRSHKQPPRRRAWYLVGAAVTAALIASVFVLIPPLVRSGACGGMFSTMTRTDTGECVGVIDDNSVLDAELRPVAERIRTENEAVAAATGRYAKIVLLTPLSVSQTSASAMGLEQIRHGLEGAYTALYRVNETVDFGGDPSVVKVQILIANFGSRQEYSDRLVKDILARSEREHPVVAVVGMGLSSTGTEATARALANRGIPMVSAVASADSLNIQTYAGLRSVSPSNSDYVQALAGFLEKSGLKSGIIVADQNNDLYVKSLRAAYDSILGDYLKFPAASFAGGTTGSPAKPRVFAPVVTNVCNAADGGKGLDMIFYAGRIADFEAFAEALRTRICPKPLMVLTAVTGFQASPGLEDVLKSSNVTLVYASGTDPKWITDTANRPEGFEGFFKIAGREFGAASLMDGFAIMYHDAVVCTARALRLAADIGGSPGPADVEIQFGNLNIMNAVKAASGTLDFNARPDGRARRGKAVFIQKIGLPRP